MELALTAHGSLMAPTPAFEVGALLWIGLDGP